MQKHQPFLIWTVQRTGSTSLANILEQMTDIKVFHEPFNTGRDLAYNKDIDTLLAQLESLKTNSIYFKHCWNVHSVEVNKLILDAAINNFYSIILLYRNNNLAREISRQLARKTGIWGQGSLKQSSGNTEQELPPFNIEHMIKSMDSYLDEFTNYRSYLDIKNSRFLEISYENLFEGTLEDRLKSLNNVANFLNISSSTIEEKQENINNWLMNYKQNTEKNYDKIPNLDDIMDVCAEYKNMHFGQPIHSS